MSSIQLRHVFLLTILFFAHNSISQGVFVSTATLTNPPATSCTNTIITVTGDYGNTNMTYAGSTFTIAGNTITLNVNYTSSGVGSSVMTPFSHNADLGQLAAGSYFVYAYGINGGNTQGPVVLPLTVTACCGAIPSFSSNATNVCVGDSALFTNTSTGTTSQNWYIDNNYVDNTYDFGTLAIMPGTFVVKMVSTNGICSDSIEQTINVYNPPVATSVVVSDPIVCEGQSITFTGTATGAFSYNWLKDGVNVGGGSSFNTVASGAGIHTYSLVVSSACTDTMDVMVEFLETPSIDSFSVALTACLGESLTLTSSSTGATNEDWYEDNVFIASGSSYSTTPPAAGIYVYQLVVSNASCSDSTEQSVEVFDLPTVDLGADTSSCGGIVTLDAGAGMTSYEWNDLTTNQTLVADSGTYYVTVTDVNGCQATDTIEVVNCASLNELNAVNVNIYPNPVDDFVVLDMDRIYHDMKLQVLDINGRIVYTQDYSNIQSIQLNCSTFESGFYFVHLKGEGLSSVVKIEKL